MQWRESVAPLLQFFADAGDQFLPSFGWLDVALALVDGALDLLSAFARQLFPELLLDVINLVCLPGNRSVFELFTWIVAHKDASLSAHALGDALAKSAAGDPQ